MKYRIVLIVLLSGFYLKSGVPTETGKRDWEIAAENESIFETIESKVCLLAEGLDLSPVFTAIDPLEQKTFNNDSSIDALDSLVDIVNEGFIGARTRFEQALSNVCLLESQMQSAADNVIDANGAIGIFITDTDVGSTGTTIGLPGKYILCEEIDTTAAVAITIAADDVELDMNGFAIRNADTAIGINAGFSNIVVQNGFIVDTGVNGIDVDTASNITFKNILVDNATSSGFSIDSSSNITIWRCQASMCDENLVSISSSDNIIIKHGLFCDQPTLSSQGGISCVSSSRIIIQKCVINGNRLRGILLSNCNVFEIFNCMCNSTIDGNGIELTNCRNGLIRENFCIENDNRGILVEQSSTQIKLIDNVCIQNSDAGITVDDSTNCYIFENIANMNGPPNIEETNVVSGANTFLSNWALAVDPANNYTASNSTINEVTIAQNGSFPSEPTKWQNISMDG